MFSALQTMSTTMSVPASTSPCYWIANESSKAIPICICFGTGRFLRSVWVPILVAAYEASPPVFLQTRGTSFVRYMIDREVSAKETGVSTYEVDAVLSDGTVRTELVPCLAAFSLGYDRDSIESKMWPLFRSSSVQIIAVGVTEAGLISHTTAAMQDLYHMMVYICHHQLYDSTQKICVLNTDNIPNNGSTIEQHMRAIAAGSSEDASTIISFFENHVVFLNSMVDRITSSRPNDSNVPRTEPVPAKAFVVLDEANDLPSRIRALATPKNSLGLVIRTSRKQYDIDLALKLRIANGTHTAIAHVMALCRYAQTDFLAKSVKKTSSEECSIAQKLMQYLDALVRDQILPGTKALSCESESDAIAVWEDWRSRLIHPHFGLSTFFITQNGAAKGGIRLSPTVRDLIASDPIASNPISSTMAFAYAALLRWLTPIDISADVSDHPEHGIYIGWLDGFERAEVRALDPLASHSESTVAYADGLRYNLDEGWYEFRCACLVDIFDAKSLSAAPKPVAHWLGSCATPQQPSVLLPIIRAYLLAPSGGDLGSVADTKQVDALVQAIAVLYSRMIVSDAVVNTLFGLQL